MFANPASPAVGRTLIPRFFRSIFEGGVTELHWELRHAKESFHQATVSLDCDQATMVTQHGKPMFTKVYTEGRLIVEFNFDDLLRIRSWHFANRNHRELIPRSVIAMQVFLKPLVLRYVSLMPLVLMDVFLMPFVLMDGSLPQSPCLEGRLHYAP